MKTVGALYLEDGSCFRGIAYGNPGMYSGEAVFNTSHSGYLEILTDPSYAGQIVVMTAPEIGNYGITGCDYESDTVFAAGMVTRELVAVGSNHRSTIELGEWLYDRAKPILTGVDTRAIAKRIRETGAMRSMLVVGDFYSENVLRELQNSPRMEGSEWVSYVSTKKPYEWLEPLPEEFYEQPVNKANGQSVCVIDFGVKKNTLRHLVHRGLRVTVLPWNATPETIRSYRPTGLLLSNGPGDPAVLDEPVKTIQALLGEIPIFGICLGHQLLARAVGATTVKLPFGHHGANHPVRDMTTGKIEITSQNHGFAVVPETLPPDANPTHWNLYDGTLEGFSLPKQNAFAVQFHPEAAPGPHDSNHLFERFLTNLTEKNR